MVSQILKNDVDCRHATRPTWRSNSDRWADAPDGVASLPGRPCRTLPWVMGVEDVDALARARDDECAKTAAASPHARRQNAFTRPARHGRTAIPEEHDRAAAKSLRRLVGRQEHSRVGTECVRRVKTWWVAYHLK